MGSIQAVGPNEAIIVSGGCFSKRDKKVIIGGWVWAWFCITDISYLPLMLMTVFPLCENVETVMGVPLTVSGVAHVKIKKDLIRIAAEQFAGMKISAIRKAIGATMEGHLRAILGSLTVEEAYKDRIKFADNVRKVAEKDVARMGMEIISFTIRDIKDDVDYLNSLGKAQIAEVKRVADIAVAENSKIAGIREAECEKEMMDIVYKTDAKIQNSKKEMDLKTAEFNAEVNSAKAQAELSYPLQEAKMKQQIRQEEIGIDFAETKKKIEIEELEILRKDLELKSTVKLPAEAEGFKLETIAEGAKIQTVQLAIAEGARIDKIGKVEAEVTGAIGVATAQGQRLKASSLKNYNSVATMSLVLDVLPKITAQIVSPLSKIEDIVILGGSGKITEEITRVATQLGPALNAMGSTNIVNNLLDKYRKKT